MAQKEGKYQRSGPYPARIKDKISSCNVWLMQDTCYHIMAFRWTSFKNAKENKAHSWSRALSKLDLHSSTKSPGVADLDPFYFHNKPCRVVTVGKACWATEKLWAKEPWKAEPKYQRTVSRLLRSLGLLWSCMLILFRRLMRGPGRHGDLTLMCPMSFESDSSCLAKWTHLYWIRPLDNQV